MAHCSIHRSQATKQLEDLQTGEWLDRQSRAVIIELTLYNAPTNLFTSVKLLLDLTPTGAAFTSVVVRSTHLFRYVSGWDNFVLACEVRTLTVNLISEFAAFLSATLNRVPT